MEGEVTDLAFAILLSRCVHVSKNSCKIYKMFIAQPFFSDSSGRIFSPHIKQKCVRVVTH